VESKGPLGVPGVVELRFDEVRPQTVAFELAKMMLNKQLAGLDGDRKPWLFPQLVKMCKGWLETELTVTPGTNMGHLMIAEFRHEAAERAFNAIVRQIGNEKQVLLPIIRRFDPVGSTDDVQFMTRKTVIDTVKSHINKVVLDGIKGNTWEEAMADTLEKNHDVVAFVKNDHLDFAIPYVHQGKSFSYIPDFLVRLKQRDGDVVRTLIVEVSGTLKSAGPTKAKADTARLQWCRSVNNAGNYGRWGYIEVGKPGDDGYDKKIADAIAALYDDDAITGMLD
jgi:type III restriction enzyme